MEILSLAAVVAAVASFLADAISVGNFLRNFITYIKKLHQI